MLAHAILRAARDWALPRGHSSCPIQDCSSLLVSERTKCGGGTTSFCLFSSNPGAFLLILNETWVSMLG